MCYILPCFSIYPGHFFFLLTCFMGQIICWKVEKIKSFFVTLEFDKKMNLQSDCWFDCLVVVLYFSLRFSSFIHSSNTKMVTYKERLQRYLYSFYYKSSCVTTNKNSNEMHVHIKIMFEICLSYLCTIKLWQECNNILHT